MHDLETTESQWMASRTLRPFDLPIPVGTIADGSVTEGSADSVRSLDRLNKRAHYSQELAGESESQVVEAVRGRVRTCGPEPMCWK